MNFSISRVDISIVIVNYNGKKLLENCLSSLYKFTKDVTFEVILIDNNSSEPIDDLMENFSEVKLIKNNKNLGFAAANNQGIKISKGKYILFLNNDTVFTENSIKKIYDFAESLNEKVFVGCKLLNSDGSLQESVVDFPSVWNTFTESFFLYKMFKKSKMFNKYYQNFININQPIEVDVIKGAFMFCDAESVKELRGFDERFFFYSEETDLCYRFKKKRGKIYYYPETSIYHLEGSSSAQNQKFYYENLITGKIKFYQKHFRGFKFFLILILTYLGILVRIPIYLFGGIILLNKNLLEKSKFYLMQLFIYPQNEFV